MTIKTITHTVKSDPRGWLVQNEDNEIGKQVKHFFVSTSKRNAIRGQHYHLKKKEWFLVIKGEARIVFEDIKSKERSEILVSASRPTTVEVPPRLAHAIQNVGKGEMYLVALVNEPLNPKNPDTFFYKVL